MQRSKKDWIEASFGDVAVQQKSDIDRGVEEVDRYVAGEHMATEDLHIRNWGVLNGQYLGPAFRRKFEKGDILYGSRRTYLKKVAVADFDGITANTTFVIKPNRDKILPGLLPFLMLSDSFTEHSVKNSKGSVNPYINWKDIANFKFKLPPMNDQKNIADLLWSIDDVTESYMVARENLNLYSSSLFNEGIKEGRGKLVQLGSLLESIEYGLSEKLEEAAEYPVLRMNNLNNGKIDVKDLKYLNLDKKNAAKYSLEPGDVLFNRTNSFELVGKTSIFKEKGLFLYASYLLRLRVKRDLLDPDYLNYYMNCDIGMSNIRKYRTPGVSQSNVNAKNLLKINVPIFPVAEQKRIVKLLNRIDEIKDKLNLLTAQNKLLIRTISNQMFGEI